MSKPFKFRYVNQIVGVFVLLALLVVAVTVLLVGHAQDWFVPKHTIYIKFPDMGTSGLKRGADVEILETSAGRLERININDDGTMEGELTINGDFIRFVRTDSMAIIKKRFAVAGDSFIDLTRGTNQPLPEGKNYIACRKDDDLTEMVQEIVQQVKEAVLPFLAKVESILAAYEAVATGVTDTNGPIQQTLLSIQRMVNDLEQGQGTAGVLLRDPETAQNINDIIESLNKLSAQLVQVGDDVKAVSATVKDSATEHLPTLTRETTETVEESRRLIEGLQNHWLLRGSMKNQEFPARLPQRDLSPVPGGTQP